VSLVSRSQSISASTRCASSCDSVRVEQNLSPTLAQEVEARSLSRGPSPGGLACLSVASFARPARSKRTRPWRPQNINDDKQLVECRNKCDPAQLSNSALSLKCKYYQESNNGSRELSCKLVRLLVAAFEFQRSLITRARVQLFRYSRLASLPHSGIPRSQTHV